MIYICILTVLIVVSLAWVIYKSKYLGLSRRHEENVYIRRKFKPIYREYEDLGERVEIPRNREPKPKK